MIANIRFRKEIKKGMKTYIAYVYIVVGYEVGNLLTARYDVQLSVVTGKFKVESILDYTLLKKMTIEEAKIYNEEEVLKHLTAEEVESLKLEAWIHLKPNK